VRGWTHTRLQAPLRHRQSLFGTTGTIHCTTATTPRWHLRRCIKGRSHWLSNNLNIKNTGLRPCSAAAADSIVAGRYLGVKSYIIS
jgi:hypothetical protein